MCEARGYHLVTKRAKQSAADSLQSDITLLQSLSDNQQIYPREESLTSPVETSTVVVQEETGVAEDPNHQSAPYNPSQLIPLCLELKRDPFLARAQLVYAKMGRDDEEMLKNLKFIYEKRRGIMRLWLSWWRLRAIRPAKVSTGF
jgi:hypothetical protein